MYRFKQLVLSTYNKRFMINITLKTEALKTEQESIKAKRNYLILI